MATIWNEFGGAPFGLEDVKIATLNADGSYGDEVDVPSVQMFSPNLQTTNAELEGDDITTAVHARNRSAELRLRFGGLSLDAYNVLTGVTVDTYGSTPDSAESMDFTSTDNYPYFGIVGKIADAEGSGCFMVFLPKVKILEGFELGAEFGQFMTPEISARGIADDDGLIMRPIFYEADTSATIPPTMPS